MLQDVQLADLTAMLLQMTCVMMQMAHLGLIMYPCNWPDGKHQAVTLCFPRITVLQRDPSANALGFACFSGRLVPPGRVI